METPVIDTTAEKVEAPKEVVKSPAADLREIQQLVVMGIFPGQLAPSVVKAYQLLESMAQKVELDAKNEAEFKARQAL